MKRFWLACRLFFRILFDSGVARQAAEVLALPAPSTPPQPTAETTAPPERKVPAPAAPVARPQKAGRSDALTLLSALQREARLIDFLQEPLDQYADAQIGAAVRDVHRGCRQVVERWFQVQPLVDQPEGSDLQIPAGFDAAKFNLTGQVSGEPPYAGQLRHHGWKAARCETPEWKGSEAAQLILAPAEVEVRG